MNFHLIAIVIRINFNCNSDTGSTITKFRSRFYQYKLNIKLYGEGRRGFVQEKPIEHFCSQNHHDTHRDMIVQIVDHCGSNDQEKRENFWIHKLKILYPDGLNKKRII